MGGRATLADGSPCRFDTFVAELEWGGVWRNVILSAIGGEVLVGVRLLAGHELRMQVVPDGTVEVISLLTPGLPSSATIAGE